MDKSITLVRAVKILREEFLSENNRQIIDNAKGHFVQFPNEKASSTQDSFICKNVHQCIFNKLSCDLTPDYIVGTDKKDCACRDYFSIHAAELACDGHLDCYDFTDELGCHRCQDNVLEKVEKVFFYLAKQFSLKIGKILVNFKVSTKTCEIITVEILLSKVVQSKIK